MTIKINCDDGIIRNVILGKYMFDIEELYDTAPSSTDRHVIFGPTPYTDDTDEFDRLLEVCLEHQGIVDWHYGYFSEYESGDVLRQCLIYLKRHGLSLNI